MSLLCYTLGQNRQFIEPFMDELLIVIVEDDPHHRQKMKKILNESFPYCTVKTISHGIEAMNYLLTPEVNKFDLVILDGKLETYPKTLIAQVNGPEIAEAMKEHQVNVPIILWTSDPKMLSQFDKVFGQRVPEIEKPCRRSNVEVILAPIIKSIQTGQEQKVQEDVNPPVFR
jgi:two-component system response regulator QseB